MKKYLALVIYTSLLFIFTGCKESYVSELKKDFEPEPCPEAPSVSYGGHEYATIQIGTQCWLQEDLKIGEQIQGDAHPANNGNIEKFCLFNDPLNCELFGGLYEWDELMAYENEENAQGICPEGWHIPSLDEWQTLKDFVSGDVLKQEAKLAYRGDYFTDYAFDDYSDADYNQTGFSLHPFGYKSPNPNEFFETSIYYYWTSTQTNNSDAESCSWGEGFYQRDKKYAHPVRCIKD